VTAAESRAGSRTKKSSAVESRSERYAAGKALRKRCLGVARPLEGSCRPSRRRRAGPGGRERPRAGPAPPAPRAHGPLRVHVLPRAALTMASDLASTPVSGIRVQCCGTRTCATSAASPPRSGRSSSPSTTSTRRCRPVGVGRQAPGRELRRGLPGQPPEGRRGPGRRPDLRPHLPRVDGRAQPAEDAGPVVPVAGGRELIAGLPSDLRKRAVKRIQKEQVKSRGEELSEAGGAQGDVPVIKDQLPPSSTPRDIAGEVQQAIHDVLARYRSTLSHAHQSLLDRYEVRDVAIRWSGRERRDPLLGLPPDGRRGRSAVPPGQGGRAPRSWSRSPARAPMRTTASAW